MHPNSDHGREERRSAQRAPLTHLTTSRIALLWTCVVGFALVLATFLSLATVEMVASGY